MKVRLELEFDVIGRSCYLSVQFSLVCKFYLVIFDELVASIATVHGTLLGSLGNGQLY